MYLSSFLVVLVSLSFLKKNLYLTSILTPDIMEQTSIQNFSAPNGELFELPQFEHPILAYSYKLRPDLITMVQKISFLG